MKIKHKIEKRASDYSAMKLPEIPLLKKIDVAKINISSAFLREVVGKFTLSAQALLQELEKRSGRHQSAADETDIEAVALVFGKNARLLDMILAITYTSGYLSMADKLNAHAIRQRAEKALEAFNLDKSYTNTGTISLNNGTKIIDIKTHSAFGRRIGRLFARIVPPVSIDEATGRPLQTSLLSAKERRNLQEQLEKAKNLRASGDVKAAEGIYKKILSKDRKNGDALRQLGWLYMETGQSTKALDYIKQALFLYPTDTQIALDYGNTLLAIKDYDAAIKFYREYADTSPNTALGLSGLALVHFFKGDDQEAEIYLQKALQISPESAVLYSHIGAYHQAHYDWEKAERYYTRGFRYNPNTPQLLHNLGTLRVLQRRNKEGRELLDRAIKLEPGNKFFENTKAYALLANGNFTEGWRLHEARLGIGIGTVLADKPMWKGNAAPNLRLLIKDEQGLGDLIQFVRYASLCKERVGKVIVVCPSSLLRIIRTVPGVDAAETSVLKWKYDEYINCMSLPHVLGTTLETIPADIPYIFVPTDEKNRWLKKLRLPTNDLKVGLVWHGSAFKGSVRGDTRSAARNMNFKYLLPLFDIPDVTFYSLQMGDAAKQADMAGMKDRLIDCMPDVKDMMDTAAIIENLDMVITVDTSVAHLAGALGKPTWIMSRYDGCWRWMYNQSQTPWYPSMRIFGQPKLGDWTSVVFDIDAALRAKSSVSQQ